MKNTSTKICAALMAIFCAYPSFARETEVSAKVESKMVTISIKADKKIQGVSIAKGEAKSAADFANVTEKYNFTVDLTDKLDKSGAKAFPIFIADTNQFTCELTGLAPNGDYTFYYQLADSKELGKYSFSIPAPPPSKQSYALAFKQGDESTISAMFNKGDGEGRVVVVKKGDGDVDRPVNGEEYNAKGEYGVNTCKIVDSYVVFAGKENKVDITNLPSGQYTIHVFEYNGSGKNISYNFDKVQGNPRVKSTMLSAPKVQEASDISENGFAISWNKISGASSYVVDVAYDPDFQNYAPLYTNSDVGNTTKFEVVDLEKNKTYYFRVRAENTDSQSAYSQVVKVEPKK